MSVTEGKYAEEGLVQRLELEVWRRRCKVAKRTMFSMFKLMEVL